MGECKKYWLEIDYPDGWFTIETTDNIEVASDNDVIPQNCKEAINKVFTGTFSNKNIVLTSRVQIVKAAKMIDVETNVQVSMLMAIGMEVKAIRPGVKCINFIRALIGIGVLKYSDDRAIARMSNGMNKKLKDLKNNKEKVSSNHADYLLWKGDDKSIGEKIYKAMTTE